MNLIESLITPRMHHWKMTGYNFFRHGRLNLPDNINIETSKACNFRCGYCPQSIEPFKQEVISEPIWELFKTKLREYRWHGVVILTKYNEFALVKNSERYVRELAEMGCKPIIFTNGSRPEIVALWIQAGAFRVMVTKHPQFKEEWDAPIEDLRMRFPKVMRVRELEKKHNHAGNVKVEGYETLDKCFSAHALYVNIDGSCSMCCLDYKSDHLVGDIRKNSLEEIWNSYRYIRNQVSSGKPATEMCKACFGTT